ncbi:hypothetical protein [Algibacter aquimarinus]|uniref:Acyltransferase n=1 Tax=Algibacter aquimarinus TaxID=1136748 RepID=A0ABP9HL67_9FLAO
MNLIQAIKKIIFEKQFVYLFSGSKVTIERGALFRVGKNVTIKNTEIYVKKGDVLVIGDNSHISSAKISMIVGENNELYIGKSCIIEEFDLSLTNGAISIEDYNILSKGDKSERPHFQVEGDLKIKGYNSLRCNIWIRFNGKLKIGLHNAINEGTEIRCDESVFIGDYNQISYDCIFWDTNTHTIYKAEKRREITKQQYPEFGVEFEKPVTKPIYIGNDCWIGKGVSILKGTKLEDRCIVGYGALLSNITVSENKTIINKPNLVIIDNQL